MQQAEFIITHTIRRFRRLTKKQYKLIALSETGIRPDYSGDSIEEIKARFSSEYKEMKEFSARIEQF